MKIYAFADEASKFIDNQITAMKNNGIAGLEIRNVDGVNVSDISDAKAREVKAKMDAASLTVKTVGSPIGKIDIEKDDFTTHIEKFKRTLEISEILGAENIRLFSFFTPSENRDDWFSTVMERLAAFCDIAQNYNVTLCHENEKGIFGDIPSRCLKIHKELPQIKAIFDPANFVQCGVDTLKAWEILHPYVKYLHIKDALSDGNVVPAGKGIGNLKAILDDFTKSGGDFVTLEPHLTVFEGLSDLEKENEKSEVGNIYKYNTADEAFVAALNALRDLI